MISMAMENPHIQFDDFPIETSIFLFRDSQCWQHSPLLGKADIAFQTLEVEIDGDNNGIFIEI